MGKVKGKRIKEAYENTPLYQKKPNEVLGNYYYIHLHKENIGRMNMGHDDGPRSHSDTNIAEQLSKYNEQRENILSNIVTNQYMNLLKESIDNVPENQWLIQKGLDINEPGSIEILENLQKVLKEGFENQFDNSKMQTMLNLEATTASFRKDSDYKRESIEALEKLLKGDNSEINKAFEFIDNILTGLAKTVELLESPKGGHVAVALSLLRKNYSSLSSLGTKINNIVDHYLEKEDGSTISSRDFIEAMGYLKNIGTLLKTGTPLGKNNNNPISVDSLKAAIQTNFYSNMGEIFANSIKKASVKEAVNFHNRTIQDVQRFGAEKFLIEFTDMYGNYNNTYMKNSFFSKDSLNSIESGKADNKFNTVVVSLDSVFEDLSGHIKMSVGISNKSYATAHIGPLSENFNSIGLGGGMNVAAGIDLLFGSDIYKKYLSYNILSRDHSDFPQALLSLQDALLTRNIVYLAAGRGKQDFSQLLLINGEVMSMWDIIKYVLNHNVGKSASEVVGTKKRRKTIDKTSEEQGIYLSIPARKNVIELAKNKNWSARTQGVNSKIGIIGMQTHIIPGKIIMYAKSISEKDLTK